MLVSVGVLLLVVILALAPLITFQKTSPKELFGGITLEDKGSVTYWLFGFGTAPFTHTVSKVITINGSLFTVTYNHSEWSVRPGTMVNVPITVEQISAALNPSNFSSVTVSITMRNNGAMTIAYLGIYASNYSGSGFARNVTSGQTATIGFAAYPSPPPRVGDTISIRIDGMLTNSSFFSYRTSVRIT